MNYYKKCEHCGYETGKSKAPKEGNMRCWKCGRGIQRDFTRTKKDEADDLTYQAVSKAVDDNFFDLIDNGNVTKKDEAESE